MKKIQRTIIIFPLLMSFTVGLLTHFNVFSQLDQFLFDQSHTLTQFEPDPNIVIVAIDEQSFEALGAWPWPRQTHATLINKLKHYEANTLAFDILFSELEEDIDSDLVLAQAIQQHGRVVLPLFIDHIRQNGHVIEIPPAPLFTSVAAALGHVHIDCDHQGVCRSVYLKEGVGEAYWPHISAAVASLTNPDIILEGARPKNIEARSPKLIYRDYHNTLLMPHYSPQYKTLSYIDVLNNKLSSLSLKNSTVFIGATSKGLNDMILTPAGPIPGVVANAMIYQTLKNNSWIKQVSPILAACVCSCIAFIFLSLSSRLSPLTFLISVVAFIGLIYLGTLASIAYWRIWFPTAALIITLAAYYPLWNWFRLHLAINYLKRYQTKLSDEQSDKQRLFKVGSNKNAQNHSGNNQQSLEVVSDTIRQLNSLHNVIKEDRFLIDQTLARLHEAVVVTETSGEITLTNSRVPSFFSLLSNDFFQVLATQYTLSDERTVKTWPEFFDNMKNQSDLVVEIKRNSTELDLQAFVLLCHARMEKYEHISNSGSFIIFTFSDITHIKRMEQQRLDTLRFLSHDLRSPMVSSLALIESIKSGKNLDDISVNLNKLESYAQKNLSYSEKIIQVSRAEELNAEDFEPCDLHAVLDSAFANTIDFAQSKNMNINIHREDLDFWVMGDMDALTRALENLVNNAIKYSHKESDIKLSLYKHNEQVDLSVEDHGPGLSSSEQTQIFQRFKKLASANNVAGSKNSGVGLGLYYVQTVAEKHKGSVVINSTPQLGSTFIIRLPIIDL